MPDLLTTINIIANVATALGFFLIAFALLLQYKQYRDARAVTIREATWTVFEKWWGKELADLREYFYYFIEHHSDELRALREKGDIGLGQVKDHFPKDQGRLRDLTYFFDQVGWLGAHGLIEVDYILGPMQHVMRRVWWATDFLIKNQRKLSEDRWLDPVRHWGLQWLFERSEAKSQIKLLKKRFPKLSLLSDAHLQVMEKNIRDDENRFKIKVGYS